MLATSGVFFNAQRSGKMTDKLLNEITKSNTSYFYTSRTWRRKRRDIIQRDNNECQICKRSGRVTVGTKEDPLIVHHIKELRQHPTLALADTNLISVCNNCHESVCHPDRLAEFKKKNRFDNKERW